MKNKESAALEGSSIHTDSLLPESHAFYIVLTSFLVCRTHQNGSSVQQAMLLRRVEQQKMQNSAHLFIEVEESRFWYGLQTPFSLEQIQLIPCVPTVPS